ncbi:MAG: LysR family transcriptional regulator [Telmatospirillum sp.]|nr:LysR family transcriptional regulator [Telmatospirillum sp.]
MIEIRHFRYFLAVAQEMHFTRAARTLHIAQPALSQNIRHIEEEIGAPLFIRRNNRDLALTPVGKVFYAEALRTLEQVERSKHVIDSAVRGEMGSLSVGFTVTTILGELPDRLRAFSEACPDVELITRELPIDALLAKLRSGQLEIICIDSAPIDPDLESVALPPLPLVVALNWKHRLAGHRAPLPLAKLAGEIFILPTPYRDYTLYDMFVRLCREAGFEPRCKYYADSAVGGIGLVAANLAVDLMHELPMIQCPKEVVWKRVTPDIPLEMRLVWRRGDMTDTMRKFLALV